MIKLAAAEGIEVNVPMRPG